MNQSFFHIKNSLLSLQKSSPQLLNGEYLSTQDSLRGNEKRETIDLNFIYEDERDYQLKVKTEKQTKKIKTEKIKYDIGFEYNQTMPNNNQYESETLMKSKNILDNLSTGNLKMRKESIRKMKNEFNMDSYIASIRNDDEKRIYNEEENIILNKIILKNDKSNTIIDDSNMQSNLFLPNINKEFSILENLENDSFALDILEKANKIKPILIPENPEKSKGIFGFLQLFTKCGCSTKA